MKNYRETKDWQSLGLTKEIISVLYNCNCGELESFRIEELSKLRKWEVMEVIGNDIDPMGEIADWTEIKRLSTFCKVYEINNVADAYAEAISNNGCEIGYAVSDDVVVIVE